MNSVDDLVTNFERFVREDIPDFAAREDLWFEQASGGASRRFVCYGLGTLGKTIVKWLQSIDLPPVAIVDAKFAQEQTSFEGIPCLSPEGACLQYGDDCVFVVTVLNQSGGHAFAEIKSQLTRLGAKCVVYLLPFLWRHGNTFLPYYALDRPSKAIGSEDEILRVFYALADHQSKRDYASFLYNILVPIPTIAFPAADLDTYFPKDILRLTNEEVFFDGGAFDGDTLSTFVKKTGGQFDRYIGVEPDPRNFTALRQRVAQLESLVAGTLETEGSAIGLFRAEMRFSATGLLGSALSESGEMTVPVARISDLVNGVNPTYVKLDIEGAELDALSADQAFVRRTKPKLAVCIYHRQDHVWRIPALMQAINPNYRIFVRRHREYLDDVVAYAIDRD